MKGTVIETAAIDSLNFCKTHLATKDIVRDDRKELAELVVTYLTGANSVPIRKTGAIHHARFLMKAIYYIKLMRLSAQLEFVYSDRNLVNEIKVMAEYISCFYAVWYLQADNVVKASFNDLTAIHSMFKYREVSNHLEAVSKVIGNMLKHVWYLYTTLVPLALLDDDVPEKRMIANAILALKMPHDNIFDYKAEDKEIVVIEEVLQFDHTSNELPSMAPLINHFSF